MRVSCFFLSIIFVLSSCSYLDPQEKMNHKKRREIASVPSSYEVTERDFVKELVDDASDVIGPIQELSLRKKRLEKQQRENFKKYEKCSEKHENNCETYRKMASTLSDIVEDISKDLDDAISDKVSEEEIISSRKGTLKFNHLTTRSSGNSCEQLENYTPGSYDPVKVIKTHFIFPVTTNMHSPGNFTAFHDGEGYRGYTAKDRSLDYIKNINFLLSKNLIPKMIDPVTSQPQTGIEFKFESFINQKVPDSMMDQYYYYSEDIDGPFTENNKYLREGFYDFKESAYNVVFQEPKGAKKINKAVLAKSARGDWFRGSKDGNFLVSIFAHFHVPSGSGYVDKLLPVKEPAVTVLVSEWSSYVLRQRTWNPKEKEQVNDSRYRSASLYDRAKVLVHEFGHTAGLNHSWVSYNRLGDQTKVYCKDHYKKKSNPWCGEGAGNNLMDYNCEQRSISPCQLSVIHYNLYHYLDKLLYKPSCSDSKYTTIIPGNLGQVEWNSPHHLAGDLIVKKGTTLTIGCSVSIASNAKVIVEPGARIINKDFIGKRSAVCGSYNKPQYEKAERKSGYSRKIN